MGKAATRRKRRTKKHGKKMGQMVRKERNLPSYEHSCFPKQINFVATTPKGKTYIDDIFAPLFWDIAFYHGDRFREKLRRGDKDILIIDAMDTGECFLLSKSDTIPKLPHIKIEANFWVSPILYSLIQAVRSGKKIQIVEGIGASIGGLFFGKKEELELEQEQPETIFLFGRGSNA